MMTTTKSENPSALRLALCLSLGVHLALPATLILPEFVGYLNQHPESLLILPVPFLLGAALRRRRWWKKWRREQETLQCSEIQVEPGGGEKFVKKQFPRQRAVATITRPSKINVGYFL